MKHLLLTIFILFCSGCSTTYGPVTSNNFQEKILIERMDRTFAAGKSLINQNECFPVLTKPICWDATGGKSFEPTEMLDMQMYEISNKSNYGIQKDFLYLAAAEVASQMAYPMFTSLSEQMIVTCSKSENYVTYGGISGVNSKCLISTRLRILLIKDKNDLKKGVLARNNSFENSNFVPFIDLYRGTTPNLPRGKDVDTPSIKLLTLDIENAWKYHYEPRNLSNELRKKLGATLTSPWTIIDEATKNKEVLNNDPITLRRVMN
jgi:hypothetical protein